MRLKLRSGWFIAVPMLLMSIFSFVPTRSANAADGNKLVFAYQQTTVSQDVNVSSTIAGGSTLTATVSAAEVQDWKPSSDTLALGIQLLGSGGGSIYSHSTGFLSLTDGGVFNDYSISVTAAGVGAGWNSVATARIFIIGQDGEFWAGNYGTQVESASLKLDGTELLTNTEFVTSSSWTSSVGWQTCSANSGYQPCIGISAVQINNASTTTVATTTTVAPTTTVPPTTTVSPAPLDGSACATSTTSSNYAYGGSGILASSSPDTFRLTQAAGNQFGAIWNKARFDISEDFCVKAEVYLGSNDGGADGLAFVMQPNSVAAGSTGGGLGYAGITPSFALEFDTWPNSDPSADHIGLMYNGNTSHYAGTQWPAGADGSQSGVYAPVELSNIEDDQWRYFKLFWDSATEELSVFFDKNADGDLSDSGELVYDAVAIDLGSIFAAGNAYWGFTAATGGANNLQQVRNITYEALNRANVSPTMPTAPASATIQSTTIGTVPFVLADDSTSQSQWTFTTSSSDTAIVPTNAISVSMSSSTQGALSITPAYTANGGSSTVTLNATDADGTTISASFLVTVTAAPNALIVSSLADTNTSGTLRWAINQANAQSGGMYDAIQITTQGTITLTSDLPAITQGVTITGTGMSTTIVDGNNLYRAIYNNGSRTIVIEDMTFKQGKNVSWNGGLIYNASGTMTFNRIKISNHSSWAFYQGGGGVTTFNNSQFANNGYAITSDHGTTPTSLSLFDTSYTNRIYINNSVFTSNTYGIRTERFTKIENSQFTGNTYGAVLNGLNRQQVINSTFTNNTGAAVYFSSWIPTSWTPGAGNQTVSGSIFNGNNVAIQFANSFNNGASTYNNVSANSWSTSTNNTFGATSSNTTNYSGSGYVSTGDTVTVLTICAPRNLTVTETGDNIVLDWDAPNCGTRQPERYAIMFTSGSLAGWGVATGNVGDANALNTYYTFTKSYFSGFDVAPGSTWRFSVRSDNDTLGLYSDRTDEVSIAIGTPPTTTTTTEPASSEVTNPSAPSSTLPDGDGEQPSETTTTSVPPIEDEEEATTTTLPESDGGDDQDQPEGVQPDDEQQEPETDQTPPFDGPQESEEEQPIDTTGPEETSPEQTENISQETIVTQEELESLIEDISSEEIQVEQVLEVIEDLNAEQLTEVLEAIEPEKLAEVIDELSEEQVTDLIENIESAEALDNVISAIADSEEPLETAVAVAIILNDNFAEISTEAAQEVFASVDSDAFTEEQKSELSETLTEAPAEIKEAFEEEINVYAEGFDEYVPLGSNVDVGARRTLIAASAVLSTIAVAGAAGAASGGPTGPSGGSSGGGSGSGGGSPASGTNDAARREDEEEEASGEIAGPEDDEDEKNYTKNSIFKYYIEGGIEMKKLDWVGLGKKIWEISAGLAFTMAGSFVMFITLSGDTRKMAIIATAVALGVHYVHEVFKKDEE